LGLQTTSPAPAPTRTRWPCARKCPAHSLARSSLSSSCPLTLRPAGRPAVVAQQLGGEKERAALVEWAGRRKLEFRKTRRCLRTGSCTRLGPRLVVSGWERPRARVVRRLPPLPTRRSTPSRANHHLARNTTRLAKLPLYSGGFAPAGRRRRRENSKQRLLQCWRGPLIRRCPRPRFPAGPPSLAPSPRRVSAGRRKRECASGPRPCSRRGALHGSM